MNDARQAAPGLHGPPGSPETLAGFSDWTEIGRGGDATVYRAIQDGLQREVAIKVLMVDDAESVRRFTREVQLMVALGRQHPNIAKVLQIGTSSAGRPCIVMDYYELGSLDRRLAAEGPLPADDVAHVGIVVADALAFAHQKGVLHRDIKPQNILMMPTSYVLADFGIARLIDQGHTASSDRFSYRHASPQVLNGDTPSELDDVFSLGATLYHLLDGQPPFTLPGQRDTALSYIKRAMELPPRQMARTDVPQPLREIVDIALRKDPTTRFQSAGDLRDALTDGRRMSRPVHPLTPAGWSPGSGTSPSAPPPAPGPIAPTAAWPAQPQEVESTVQGPPRADEDEDSQQPRLPFLAIAGTGIVVGVLVVILLWFLTQGGMGPGTNPGGNPSGSATPTGGATREATPDPNLQPSEIRIIDNGDTVDVSWSAPAEEPAGYALSYLVEGESVETHNSDTTFKTLPPAPDAPEICVRVMGISSDARMGSAEACIPKN